MIVDNAYPELTRSRPQLVQKAAETAAAVFARNSVPEMKTNWETHPNNIGHDEFPGCWRCHDDELTTPDGESHLSGRGQPDATGPGRRRLRRVALG
jgi:hypothetical protein